jgi:hypothetical protein
MSTFFVVNFSVVCDGLVFVVIEVDVSVVKVLFRVDGNENTFPGFKLFQGVLLRICCELLDVAINVCIEDWGA